MSIGCAGAIKQGASFEDFMVRSAAISISSANSPLAGLQLLEETPFAQELIDARAYLETLASMSDDEAQVRSDAEYESQCAQREAVQQNRRELRQRYEHALGRLFTWNPDIPAFESFRASLIDQITQSIECDCRECSGPPLVRLTANQWRVQSMADQTLLISHIERRNRHFAVLQALRTSLGIAPSAPT